MEHQAVILVVAYNYGTFQDWCYRNKISPRDKRLVFLSDINKARSVDKPYLLYLSGWAMSPVFRDQDFEVMMASRRAKEITSKEAIDLLKTNERE